MGLDITAYKNIELVGTAASGDEWEEKFNTDKTQWIWPGQYMPERLPPIQPNGVYKAGDSWHFRAGPYSYYGRWRSHLAWMALGVSAETVWANPAEFEGRPFVELINFSDCEGVLGTQVCQKLLKDFQEWQEEADQNTNPHFTESYNDWRKAFEFAANNGYVDFH